MSTWKEEGALRIMEALSGVDEELLERCEQPEAVKRKKTTKMSGKNKIYRFMRRYGKVCAACICLAVLGGAYGVSALRMGSSGANMQGFEKSGDALPEAGEQAEAIEIETAGEEEKYVETEEGTAEAGTTEAARGYGEPCWLDIDMLVERALYGANFAERIENSPQSQLSSVLESEKTDAQDTEQVIKEMENSASASGAEISWEDVYSVEGLGNYVPVEWPEGYIPLAAEQSTGKDMRNNLLLTWTNQEHTLWLNLTETELNKDMLQESEEAVFAVEEDWQSKLPEPEADGSIQFALLYEDGVLAEYKGWLTVSEILELFGE